MRRSWRHWSTSIRSPEQRSKALADRACRGWHGRAAPSGGRPSTYRKGHDGLLGERAIASVDIAQPIADGAEPVLQVHHGGPVDTWLHVVTLLLEG
jgi:hypothetical protein